MIFRTVRNLLLVERLATPAKKHRADIITLSPYLRDKAVPPPVQPGAVAIFIRTIRPVIVLAFRVWMFASAVLLVMVLGGCAGNAVSEKHGDTYTVSFTEIITPGAEGSQLGASHISEKALELCPDGYKKISENVQHIPGEFITSTNITTWEVRCQ